MQYKLSQSVKFDGQEISELDLDFSKLNKANYDEAVAEFKMVNPLHRGEITTSIKFTKFIIAKLINQPVIFILSIPVPDLVALRYNYFNEIHQIRENSTTLELELNKLTTRDYELAEDRFLAKKPQFAGAIELESGYMDEVLGIAAKLSPSQVEQLDFGTYLQAKEQVTSFLFGYFSTLILTNSKLSA